VVGVQKCNAILNRVHGAALAALQRSLGDFLFERLGNGILEALFFGQAARADEHVEQAFYIFFQDLLGKFLKTRRANWFVGTVNDSVITGAPSIAGKLG
jgi:hypothetical protein